MENSNLNAVKVNLPQKTCDHINFLHYEQVTYWKNLALPDTDDDDVKKKKKGYARIGAENVYTSNKKK